MKRSRSILNALVAAATLLLVTYPTWAAEDTTGRVTIESTSVAAGLGVTWGEGVLEYRGQRYPFTVNGFSIIDVGVSKVFARGEVYDLKSVEDFEGVFMAAVVSGTFGGGAGAAAMQNQRDVKMVWTATNQGLSLSLAQAGFKVTMADSEAYRAAQAQRNASAGRQPTVAPRTP
jgi:hypothetical protein